MAAFMFRGRSLKSRRTKGRADGSEEHITLDYHRDPADNFKEALYHIVRADKLSKTKRLGYYNALVRLCYRFGCNYDIELSTEEIFYSLRYGLVHGEKEVRVACLRLLRYLCQEEKNIDAILNLNIDYLIVRCLDLNIDNELERIHALRLAKKMMQIYPAKFPQSLVSVLISVANNGMQERDKLHRTCLAMLCELSFSSPCLVCRRGGVTAILNNVLQCPNSPRIIESLLTTVLFLLNHPCSRHFILTDIGIEQLLAPFTDCHFKYTTDPPDTSFGEESSNKYTASKIAISTLVKSWPGLIRLCKPDGTGLQSLIGVLYLPFHEIRREVLGLLYDVFRLQVPEWTDNFAQALVSVDPSEIKEAWKISEGFVAEEGRCVLLQLAQTRANLTNNHTAMVLAAFVTAGLLEALVEVITDADVRIAIKATILLGELLHLANSLIPTECGYHSHCLPTLIDIASSIDNPRRNRASMAVKCLDRLHNMKKRGPIPCSLYLDQLVKRAKSRGDSRVKRPLSHNRERLLVALNKPAVWHVRPKKLNTLEKLATATSSNEVDHDVNQALKDSLVLSTKVNLDWDWQLISAILKWPDDNMKKFEDQAYLRFLKRLLFYFKPEKQLFSTLELSSSLSKTIACAGQYFLRFLLNCDNDEAKKLLKEWLGDVGVCLGEIKGQRAPSEALLSAHRVINTCAQYYFLFIGQLSGTALGDQLLQQMGIYQSLLELVSMTTHENYVKLVISSLDYGKEGQPRVILAKALKASSDSARLYCVSMLRVLMRAKVPFFHQWGMDLLVLQLYDSHKPVSQEAINVLAEACEDQMHLQSMVKLKPSVLHLGTAGAMIFARMISTAQGFTQYSETDLIQHELQRWHETLNAEYVQIVDEKLYEAFTTYEKSYDGSYFRRSSRSQGKKDAFVPIHIYGQLVQHQEGFDLLSRQRQVIDYVNTLQYQNTRTEKEVLLVKQALWALGHFGTSALGLEHLQELGVVPQMIKLAEESGVFSIRGTAFYVLGLISCTCKGADILNEFGWESVRHKITDKWPVMDEPGSLIDMQSHAPSPPGLDPGLNTCASAVSIASSNRSDYLLPAVTLEFSLGGVTPPQLSPAAGVSPCFVIGSGGDESCSSSYKSRSNTVNTLDTVSEHGDDERIETILEVDSSDNVQNQNDQVNDNNSTQPNQSAIEEIVDAKTNHENNHSKEIITPNDIKSNPVVHELSVSSSENWFKGRSLSTPMDYDKRADMIHPRTTSDPRGMSETKLNSQAAVHFKDPDLESRGYDKSILRRKEPRSASGGSTGDAGISSPSNPSSFRSRAPLLSNGSERAGSHDSYRTATEKSRSNSINTEDTSGVGSFGSSYPNHSDAAPNSGGLSPIPSASSLHSEHRTSNAHARDSAARSSGENTVHPSDVLRRMSNLKRIPSTKRRFSNPVLTPILKTLHRDSDIVNEYALSYATTRDVQGYATLRELKRLQRIDSSEGEAEARVRSLNDHPSPMTKTQSLDLRVLGRWRESFRKRISWRISRRKSNRNSTPAGSSKNVSLSSFQDAGPATPLYGSSTLDLRPGSRTSSMLALNSTPTVGNSIASGATLQRIPTIPNIQKPKPVSTGRPEYMGICLPVDVTMIFHVNEGEDIRSVTTLRERADMRSKKSITHSTSRIDDGFEHHCAEICLACYTVHRLSDEPTCDSGSEDDAFEVNDTSSTRASVPCKSCKGASRGEDEEEGSARIARRPRCGMASRHTSLSEYVSDANVSAHAIGTVHKGALNEDTFEGRVLVRKEILRLVVNCSSSVSTDSTEQGLLVLKQKFPKTFQDVCLYSEISYILAIYNYRLKARKFIQELFQDMTFEKFKEDAQKIAVILSKDIQIKPTQPESDMREEENWDNFGESFETAEHSATKQANSVRVQIDEDDESET